MPRSVFLSVPVLAALALAAPAAAQQDFRVVKIEVNQALQTGATPLMAGRATFVRATVRLSQTSPAPIPLDGLLRVFVGGVEQPGSPVFSDNGPFPALLSSDPASEDGTLNFVFLPPQASGVVLTVQVNPAGPNFVPEADTSNNTLATAPLSFGFQRVPEIAYAPIDYRPSGGPTPNPPNAALIAPGSGDGFVQGIYPTPDWYYHRQDAPTKLWTSSLSGSGSSLLSSLGVDINLMSPKPDFLYGWVPGGLPYNGQAIIGGKVSMGNTEPIRFQRTMAHELGHNFGLSHNTVTVNLIGVDVEHHLLITQGLPQIKAASLKDIMYAGLLTNQAWVSSGNYGYFFNHSVFNAADAAPAADDAPPGEASLIASGTWNTETGEIDLIDVLTVEGGRRTPPAAPGEGRLLLRTSAEGLPAHVLPLAARSSADCGGDTGAPVSPLVPFTAVLPAHAPGGEPVDRLSVAPAGAPAATAVLERSASPPEVRLHVPGGGDLAAAARAGALTDGTLAVAWEASDADGDALRAYLRYSPDGERFAPLATGTTEARLDVPLASLPAFVEGRGFLELLVSDGLNTTRVRSAPFTGGETVWAGVAGNPPWVEILTPDSGTTHLEGATVILHSSGWDLEDRGLGGASLQWSSSLDGALGEGRLLAVADLSPGVHVITVTATDEDGLVADDAATIIVAPRGLPTVGGTVCQDDLGFGGPGGSVLSVCGGDLSAGTSADLVLTGAPPSATVWLAGGFVGAPTPFKGGMFVPVPIATLLVLAADATGTATLSGLAGGGGPLSLYLQCFMSDAAQPLGTGLSNAVRLDLLP